MITQKQINSHYYIQWYTPADSMEMDHQIELIKKRKKVPQIEKKVSNKT
jgi:hypothetical protein